MPTPSSPDDAPPQSFASTCPDDQMMLHSTASWNPPPPMPPPYPVAVMDDDHSHDNLTGDEEMGSGSRSATMSPRPRLGSASDGPALSEPESLLSSHHRHDGGGGGSGGSSEDSHKQADADADEDMAGASRDDQGVLRPMGPAGAALADRVADGHVFLPAGRRRRIAHRSSEMPSPVSADADRLDVDSSMGGLGWADDDWFPMGTQCSNLRVCRISYRDEKNNGPSSSNAITSLPTGHTHVAVLLPKTGQPIHGHAAIGTPGV